MSTNSPTDFVIVTALEEERDAVLSLTPSARKINPSPEDVRVYYVDDVSTQFPDGSSGTYKVVITCQLGMGRVEAAGCVGDAIRRWQPRYVLLVGIAGGIADAGVALGDVLVSDQIVDYEIQKLTTSGPQVRYSVYGADSRLLGAAQNLSGRIWWERMAQKRPVPGSPNRCVGPIASGDKVVAVKGILERYRRVWPKLIGFEMEGGGAASACFKSAARPGFFMIRGVSDLADEAKDARKTSRWRAYAREIAASYALELIRSGPVSMAESAELTEHISVSIPVLTLRIKDWFDIDELDLLRSAFSLVRDFKFPEHLKVKLDAPDFQMLAAVIREQQKRQTDPHIVSDQLGALATADGRIANLETCCARLLANVTRTYNVQRALKCCSRFVRHSLLYIIKHLARYQLANGPNLFHDFLETMHDLDPTVGVVWLAYQASPLVEIKVAGPGSRYPEQLKEFSTAFVPLNRISNDCFGGLLANFWEEAEYIPEDVWLEYVVPQMALGVTIGYDSYCPWTRESSMYCTEGHVFVDGVKLEYEPTPIGSSMSFLVDPFSCSEE
jgi:nucleoside phosphorylase